MREFFKPSRKTFGLLTLLTLLMACVFAGGWVRSRVKYDFVSVNFEHSTYRFGSVGNHFSFIRIVPPNGTKLSSRVVQPGGSILDWESGPLTAILGFSVDANGRIRENQERWNGDGAEWRWDCAGVHFKTALEQIDGVRTNSYAFPYWVAAIPLTLISAYLLLSKPRNSIQKKTLEPIPVEGR